MAAQVYVPCTMEKQTATKWPVIKKENIMLKLNAITECNNKILLDEEIGFNALLSA